MSKIDVGKYELIRTSKHHESIYAEQPDTVPEFQKKKSSERLLAFQGLKNSEERLKLTSKKTLNSLKATQGLVGFKQENDALKKHLLDRVKLDKKQKFKKARNMSQ